MAVIEWFFSGSFGAMTAFAIGLMFASWMIIPTRVYLNKSVTVYALNEEKVKYHD